MDSTLAAARDIPLQLEHSDADGDPSLGRFGASSIKTSSSAAAVKRDLGEAGTKWAPGATWSTQGTPNFPKKTIHTCSAFGTRQETQQQAVSAPGQLLSGDFRTQRPPYEPHTAQSTG